MLVLLRSVCFGVACTIDNAGCFYGGNAPGLVIKKNVITSTISGVKGIIIFSSDGSEVIENNEIAISGDGSGGKDCIGILGKHGLTSTYQASVKNNHIHVLGSANGGIWADNDNVLIHNNLVYGPDMKFGIKIHGGNMGGSPAGDKGNRPQAAMLLAVRQRGSPFGFGY